MERIKLVEDRLQRIEDAYYPFFQQTKTQITDYVRIMPNSANNWLNVTVRNDVELLPEIKTQIKKNFKIVA